MLTTKFINKGYTKNIHHSCSSFCNLNNSKIPIILWDYCVWRRVTGKIHSLILTCFLIVLFVGFYRINIKHYPCNSLNICPLLFPLCLIESVISQHLWRYPCKHLTSDLGQTQCLFVSPSNAWAFSPRLNLILYLHANIYPYKYTYIYIYAYTYIHPQAYEYILYKRKEIVSWYNFFHS